MLILSTTMYIPLQYIHTHIHTHEEILHYGIVSMTEHALQLDLEGFSTYVDQPQEII